MYVVGQAVQPGNVIIRQNGTRWHPGTNVKLARDYTIYAMKEGTVYFHKEDRTDIGKPPKTIVSVKPLPGTQPSRDAFYLQPVIIPPLNY
jgi:ribosomal protein L27